MTDMKIENRKISRSASENDKQHKKSFAIETEAFNSPDHTLARLNSSRHGLTTEDALERLDEYGRNEVAHEQAPPALIQLLQAFNNPFIYVLMALAAVSFVTDYWLPLRNGEETDLTGIIIIVTMVSLSGLLRFWQEFRTNKAAQALKSMVRTTATVLRRGPGNMAPVQEEIAIEELVPGDIIFLAAGDLVPADVRLLESRDLFVSQSILSGESLPVEKYDVLASVSGKGCDRLPEPNKDKSLLEMGNICLMGTNVTSGRAQAVVVATGNRTWFGSLAKSIVGTRTQTAFDRGVNSVSWLLIRFMLVMVPIVLLINGFSKGDWVEASLFALAVAVGLTPEMLPMIVSSNLAKGAIAMSRRKVIVKRLNAIQNFGAMDVLCTDKTGTLTQDNIILEHHLDVSGHESDRVLTLAWLNSSSQSGARNLMDRAVLRFGEGRIAPATKERFVKLDELPFDFVRRRVSVSVEDVRHGDKSLICKGAVEEMLMVATHLREGDNVVALDETRRDLLLAKTKDYNAQGFRVLLVATRKLDDSALTTPLCTADEQGLTVEGMLTFLDPPKESAGKAITALRDNGVAVKVLTGDNPVVTARICL
ncbi:magnesium-translocating P-type ATPase, partial [Klebsiella oxytoca]|nr:magnesium-translocating P-type ATPase [Klebsiella oxytoca]